MSEESANNKRIAKNTLLLYVRMLFLMLISLYTSRVILNALGVEDYGIYNVVGGVVTMFTMLSGSLSAAISRFITFELGTGDTEKLKKVFSSSVTIQVGIALLVILIGETVGLWFLNEKMVIPENRITAANWCFQFSIITFAINLISVPYNAAIIAHEKMSAFAYISIIEGLGKLAIAWCIVISPIDKLVFFAGMVAVLAIIIRIIYGLYCKYHFKECVYHFIYDHDLLKQMCSFAGWNFIGSSSGILRDQGINILLNLFFGPSFNASRGIAFKVQQTVQSFVGNFLTALTPPITKKYASCNYQETFKLVFFGARFSYYLLLLISLPVLIETNTILSIWLNVVPEYTVIFVRLILIYLLTESVSFTMVTLMLATGNIKKYQIIVGGCQMLNFPVSYLFLKMEFSPEITIIVSIGRSLACLCLRLRMLKQMVEYPVKRFIIEVLLNVCIVTILSVIVPIYISSIMTEGIIRLLLSCIISVLSVLVVTFFVGCKREERMIFYKKLKLKM